MGYLLVTVPQVSQMNQDEALETSIDLDKSGSELRPTLHEVVKPKSRNSRNTPRS